MHVSPILFVLGLLTVSPARTDSPIGNGACIIIEKGEKILFAVPSGEPWAGYLRLITKCQRDLKDEGKWILEQTSSDHFKLKNKQSNRTVDIETFVGTSYLKAVQQPRFQYEFKFLSRSNDTFGVYSKNGIPTRDNGNGWIRLSSEERSDSFKIRSCPSK
jgi:hypothetical protein